mgnify:CR=1 FL=1|jgi:hypothetical protein|tara:strand:- start:77 stop:349 length:273 start_codon:yes stop_codon:yes gene_type:complete
MAKFIKFTYDTDKTYYLPVDSTSAVGQASATGTAVKVATGGNVVTITCAADTGFSMQIALSKAIYDVLSDSQLLKVDWTPSKAISKVEVA